MTGYKSLHSRRPNNVVYRPYTHSHEKVKIGVETKGATRCVRRRTERFFPRALIEHVRLQFIAGGHVADGLKHQPLDIVRCASLLKLLILEGIRGVGGTHQGMIADKRI
ncbi:hypothetical protein SAMN05216404_11822 [Nitrosospira multiformis]|uniref:Uncharacterized protein n=1 Tax=Nitrosospira multiformis TaxID=1231 RepID=A0A1H8NZB1_9PROT|nr:hypothetical protein SAMN05216404_11822 [Nitrosospira multiformis]